MPEEYNKTMYKDQDYSNREIDQMFCSVKDHIDSRHLAIMETLTRIEAQTIRTNGRVRRLEIWRGVIIGGIAIIVTVVIPLTVYAWNLALDK